MSKPNIYPLLVFSKTGVFVNMLTTQKAWQSAMRVWRRLLGAAPVVIYRGMPCLFIDTTVYDFYRCPRGAMN